MVGLIIFLLVCTGICKAFMDAIAENIFPTEWKYWWFKDASWENKWKLDKYGLLEIAEKGDNWWYLGIIKPKYKERFPLSSTWLVFLTDGWHFFQFLFLKCIVLVVLLFEHITNIWYLDFFIIVGSMGIPFELTHSYLKKLKNN